MKVRGANRKTLHSANQGRASQREMLVELLRAFAQRTAVENRSNLSLAHGKLHTINALAREIVFTAVGRTVTTEKARQPCLATQARSPIASDIPSGGGGALR
jgi:hypothetical protein